MYKYCFLQGQGVDYSSGPYNATFTAGYVSSSFNISINDDNVFEQNEELYLKIDQSSLLHGVKICTPNSTVVKIFDNDRK